MVSFAPQHVVSQQQEARPLPLGFHMGESTSMVFAVSGVHLVRAVEILRLVLGSVAVWSRVARYVFRAQTPLLVHLV